MTESSSMGLGQRLTHSMASSREPTCHSQKPATSSLVSAKGPSTTVRLSPENTTRAPFELGCRPSPARSTPAFMSSSLYVPISVMSCSLGMTPASLSAVALTMIMNRMSCLLGESLSPMRRTAAADIDMAPRKSSLPWCPPGATPGREAAQAPVRSRAASA